VKSTSLWLCSIFTFNFNFNPPPGAIFIVSSIGKISGGPS
jgi:hypothetical protein